MNMKIDGLFELCDVKLVPTIDKYVYKTNGMSEVFENENKCGVLYVEIPRVDMKRKIILPNIFPEN